MGAAVSFGILGPLEVRTDRDEPAGLGGVRQRALLVVLLLHPNEVVSTDRLIDLLWPDQPPATALHTIQVFVSRLRRVLGDAGSRLSTRPPGYVLTVEPDELDSDRCARLYERGRRALAAGFAAQAAPLLRDALGLWRGPPLADFTYEPFAQATIARLEELRVSCREELIEAELAVGGHAAVIADLEALVREHPLRERPRGQLMLALYRSGRQAEALEVFQHARRMLVDELAVEPASALRELEQAILRQDPELLGAKPPAAPPAPPPVPAATAPAQARKVVTMLACEVSAAGAGAGELDPEVMRELMHRCLQATRSVVHRHGGDVHQLRRGAWMSVFGVPRLHEDDALRAVRAAHEIRQQLPKIAGDLGATLSVRAGVSTGLVVTDAGEPLPIGEPLDIAAELAHAAAGGEILLGPRTLRLVSDAVRVESLTPAGQRRRDDREARSGAARLIDMDPLAQGVARRLDSKLVGRRTELRRLRETWELVCEHATCQLFTLLGTAGVGKSRLVAELLSAAGEVTVLSGRCLPYGEGITFWPMVEALAPVGERAQAFIERLRTGGSATPEELFWEVRGLLESLAATRPVILYVDDLQWGESMLLDLIEHVVDLSRGAPILVLCTARLELYEHRPTWGGGKLNATSVLLEPLARPDAETLLEQVGAGLEPQLRDRLVDASEGNPLFLEEMAALARERGEVAVPPTIQALLAARLENLPAPERELLARGAIIGQHFDRSAVHQLAGDEPLPPTDALVAALVRKDLIRPISEASDGAMTGGGWFRFRHLLIRDAAYDGLPKAVRARLHARYASWLEATADELLEFDQIAGWHIEQAARYERELGSAPDAALERRGAVHLHTAGRRARERSDTAAARNLLDRSHTLAATDQALQIRIGLDLAEQLIASGELQRADELLAAAERAHDTTGLAALSRFEWLVRVRPEGANKTFRTQLPAILRQLERNGDERGIAKAHLAAREMEVMVSHATPAAEAARQAAEHARLAGDEGLRARALGLYITSITYGRQDTVAMARELAAIPPPEPGSFLAARLELGHAALARFEGRFDDARAAYARAIEGFRTLGIPEDQGASEADLARAELAAGDPHAALEALTRSDLVLAQLGERPRRSTTQAHIAQVHALLGDRDAARAAVKHAEELGAPEDVLNVSITHQVRAALALADGDGEEALRCARSSVEHVMRTDYVVFQGDAVLGLARIEAALGHTLQAAARAREARDLYAAKGDLPDMALAEELLASLSLGRSKPLTKETPKRPAKR